MQAQGTPAAQLALKEVLNNPLYDYGIAGAERIVFNLTGDKGMKMQDVAEISKSISSLTNKGRIIFGISFHPEFKDKLRIALFAAGCKEKEGKQEEKVQEKPVAKKKRVARKVPQQAKPKQEKKDETKKSVTAPKEEPRKEQTKVRRNALDVKKAQDRELKDLEKQERQWDIPSFLRSKREEEPTS